MSQSSSPERSVDELSNLSTFPTFQHTSPTLQAKMIQRRAIACTICAKAKTKCDKAVPSCSRCIAKGLQCEPRSTRRTSDNTYRQTKKQLVTPKRFPSSSSIPTMRRETSPRSVPATDMRHRSNTLPMNIPTSSKTGHGHSDFTSLSTLTPLETYGSQTVNSRYSDYGSPDPSSSAFPPSMEKSGSSLPGHFTPQTPDSFGSQEDALPFIADPFDQYLNPQLWTDDSQVPLGLGLDSEMTDMPQSQPFWSPEFDSRYLSMHTLQMQESPVSASPPSLDAWPTSGTTMSPIRTQHTQAAPSSSTTDCSVVGAGASTAAQENWPCFQCNPSDARFPKASTPRQYLEGLRALPKNPHIWADSIATAYRLEGASYASLKIERVEEHIKDATMAVTRDLLKKACTIYEAGSSPSLSGSDAVTFDESLLASPSSAALEYLFTAYGSHFELYYPNYPTHKLDAKDLLKSDASKLFLLLSLAAGASTTPTKEASDLTNGFVESSRILLADLTDNDLSLWKSPLVLRAALLSINLAAWSGQKWHMDVAKSQSDLYLTMLRRSGLFAFRENFVPNFDGLVGTEIGWIEWRQNESLNRLVYSSVIVDQELSLFYDRAPSFSITELTAALPDRDVLWQAGSADSWSLAYATTYDGSVLNQDRTPPSLFDLYKRLTNGELVDEGIPPTKLQLRLLLHPLQALVHHLHQCLGCFAGDSSSTQAQSLFFQIREVQSTLQDWYSLATKQIDTEEQECPVTIANLIIYHLICLNTMTYFPDVEAFARGEMSQQQIMATTWARTASLGNAQQIWFHCGQLIRLVRTMPAANRPLWLPAVIYRVSLLLWSTGTVNQGSRSIQTPTTPFSDSMFAIDNMHPEHVSLVRYIRFREGIPMLSTRKGVLVSPTAPSDTINYCLEVIKEEEMNTHFAKGISSRLEVFANRVRNAALPVAANAPPKDTQNFMYTL